MSIKQATKEASKEVLPPKSVRNGLVYKSPEYWYLFLLEETTLDMLYYQRLCMRYSGSLCENAFVLLKESKDRFDLLRLDYSRTHG